MKNTTITKLIELLGNRDHLKIENGEYMPLTIEKIGEGPHGHPAVSICHYGEQNGDAMRDPEMCFEIFNGEVFPYYFRNDYMGIEQEVYPVIDGVKMIRPRLKKDLESFARQWGSNLRDQGFLIAGKAADLVAA